MVTGIGKGRGEGDDRVRGTAESRVQGEIKIGPHDGDWGRKSSAQWDERLLGGLKAE